MKKPLILLVLMSCIFLPRASARPTKTEKTIQTIHPAGAQKKQEITLEYPVYAQARIEALECAYSPADGSNSQAEIKISGFIRNLFSRDLINASVTVTCFDPTAVTIGVKEKKIIPPRIQKNRRRGHFIASIPYNPEISSCQIEITWQGKAE